MNDSDQRDEALPADEPPRLQETAEREAVRLPLPGDSEPAGDTAETPAPEPDPAPETVPEPAPAIEPPFAPEPVPAAPEHPGEGPAGDDAPPPPPFAPAAEVSDIADSGAGARPEILVGAAFAGGLLLALVLRRLRG